MSDLDEKIKQVFDNSYAVSPEVNKALHELRDKVLKILEGQQQKLQEFCKDVKRLIVGIGWFNVDEEEDRVWKFIEEYFPELCKPESVKPTKKETTK